MIFMKLPDSLSLSLDDSWAKQKRWCGKRWKKINQRVMIVEHNKSQHMWRKWGKWQKQYVSYGDSSKGSKSEKIWKRNRKPKPRVSPQNQPS